MKVFLFFTLAVLWLGVIFKWQMRKNARRERSLHYPGNRGEWTTGPCDCGARRREWTPLEVCPEAFALLLRCRQCGQFWEEKLEGKAYSKWRKVDNDHVRACYNIEPAENDEPVNG